MGYLYPELNSCVISAFLGSQKVPRISLGSAFEQARGGRFDFKIAAVRQNSVWGTGVADQIRTRGAPQSRHALIAVFAALAPLGFVSLSSISRRAGSSFLARRELAPRRAPYWPPGDRAGGQLQARGPRSEIRDLRNSCPPPPAVFGCVGGCETPDSSFWRHPTSAGRLR